MEKELICIGCPNGCHLKVDESFHVTGNLCKKGEEYAVNELTHPMRTITSTVKLKGSKLFNVLPVKSSGSLPKDKLFDVMGEINKVSVNAPVKIGQVIIKNVLGLGVDIISSRGVTE